MGNIIYSRRQIVTGSTVDYSYLGASLSPSVLLAFSIRLLVSGYTGYCLKVRRSSDDTLLDIGFVDGELDTDALLSFCGAGNGFVHTLYDQSGDGLDATQTTDANQPQIVSSGALVTNGGKTALSFDGINDFLNIPDHSFGTTQSVNIVFTPTSTITGSTTPVQTLISGNVVSGVHQSAITLGITTTNFTYEIICIYSYVLTPIFTLVGYAQTSESLSGTQSITFDIATGNGAMTRNGLPKTLSISEQGTFSETNYPSSYRVIGASAAGGTCFNGKLQEFYVLDKSIVSSLNSYYGV